MRIADSGGSRVVLQRLGTVFRFVVNDDDYARLGRRLGQNLAGTGRAGDGLALVEIRNRT